tara:strand:- start:8606 stop:9070 length:465 start_codon:yes stop_codon:yes gene_type:complete
MKLLTEMVLAIVLTMTALYAAAEVGVHVGVWTEHTVNDGPDLNEKNELIQVTKFEEWDADKKGENLTRYFTTTGRFLNSHYKESFFIGGGREFSLIQNTAKVGVFIAAVKGYANTPVETHYDGLLFIPVVYFDYEFARITAIGPIVSAGVTYEF